MMEYINRTYREYAGEERWRSFAVCVKETDLWIGVDVRSFRAGIIGFVTRFVQDLRGEMEAYLVTDPEYVSALCPYMPRPTAPAILHEMAEAARQAGIGPMSAVAGAIARRVGEAIRTHFGVEEVIVENGGDIYASLQAPVNIAVFAGESPLSQKIGIQIPADATPLGICTSSGTVGPSLSFGKADAMMIVCKSCALADAYATAFANTIQTADDIPACMARIGKEADILSAICIKDDKTGIFGGFELKFF